MSNWSFIAFTVKERPDGTPWLAVDTPSAGGNRLGDPTVALRLNLCATYTDAREIADFLNRRLHLLSIHPVNSQMSS